MDFLLVKEFSQCYINFMTWLKEIPDGIILKLHIVPRSSRTQICGEHGDALKIKLQAPPVEGKANKALTEFIADKLDIPQRNISILAGDTGRNKRVLVSGISGKTVIEMMM